MKRITIRMLRRMGACKEGRQAFLRVFPSGEAEINQVNYSRAVYDPELRDYLGWTEIREFLEGFVFEANDALQLLGMAPRENRP